MRRLPQDFARVAVLGLPLLIGCGSGGPSARGSSGSTAGSGASSGTSTANDASTSTSGGSGTAGAGSGNAGGVDGSVGGGSTPWEGGTNYMATTPPDFGPNVLIFDPSMPMAMIQSSIDNIYNLQYRSQFGTGRYTFFFKPGNYTLDVKVAYYMQVVGLGQSPDDVVITGAVRSKDGSGGAATINF